MQKPFSRPGRHLPAIVLLVAAAVAGLPAPARAQTEAPQPTPGQPPPDERLAHIFREVTEVNVVNVDVVVTDAEGRPVTGLTAEDFELLEDGRPVMIDNFFAVENGLPVPLAAEALPAEAPAGEAEAAAAPEPPAAPDLHLVVFVDNANLRPVNRARVLEQLRWHLESRWRPGMRVMLASNEREVVVRQGFTEERGDLFAALDELEGGGVRGLGFDRDLAEILRQMERINVDAGIPSLGTKDAAGRTPEESTDRVSAEAQALVPQMTVYAQAKSDEVRATLRVLTQMVEAVAGLPGRKALLYVSDGLTVNPAEALFEIYDRRFAPLGPVAGAGTISSETGRFDLTSHFETLLGAANAGRVTFYTLDASPPAAVRRGGADAGSNFAGPEFASTEDRNEQESLVMMAEETGGRAGLVPAALDAAFGSFFQDLDNYYSLGYAADRREEERSLEVRLRNPRRGLQIRHRAAVRDKTADERMAERTLSALLVGSSENPLQISVETGEHAAAEGGNFQVPVIARIPLGKLVLLPGPREHQAQVALYVAALDEKGRTSEVVKHLCPIRIPNAELLVALGREAGCGLRLLMRPGGQHLAVSVRDELAAVGSTVELSLEVGAAPGGAS